MEVIFDPAKDAENIRKHGISLKRAEDFDEKTALFAVDDSQDYGEVRYKAIGWLDAMLAASFSQLILKRSFERSAFAKQLHRSKETMPKNAEIVTELAYGVPDAENPEWTKKDFARAKRFHELPPSLQRALKRGKRGPQKAPTKELISVRLSPDVLAALRAKGDGWQSLIDETLRREFLKQPKAATPADRS